MTLRRYRYFRIYNLYIYDLRTLLNDTGD